MKKVIFMLILCFGMISCKDIHYIDNEQDIMLMSNVISLYMGSYAETPKSAEDLMIYIERNGTNTFDTYGNQYQFLSDNKERLLFVTTDSMITIYDKCIDDKRMVISMTNESKYAYKNKKPRKEVVLFDKQGYYLISDTISNELFSMLNGISRKYVDNLSNKGKFQLIMIEYTNNGLKNLTNDILIDYIKSNFYTEIYDMLDMIAKKNNLSRIIISCFAENR